MQLSYSKRNLTGLLAAAVTVAAFAKTFVPFFLIGSTAIFVGASALGIALAAMGWRRLRDDARYIPEVLVALAALWRGRRQLPAVFTSRRPDHPSGRDPDFPRNVSAVRLRRGTRVENCASDASL